MGMLKVLLFLLFVSSARLELDLKDHKIVGGEVAEPQQFPHQVALIVKPTLSHPTLCGGSLINDRTILTAAHCLHDARETLAVIGAHDIAETSEKGVIRQLVNRTTFKVHPQFNFFQANLDIALIFLQTPVIFSHSIQPVKLPSKFLLDECFAGEIGTVSGFGQFCDSCGSSSLLRFTKNRIMSNQDCSKSFGFSNIPSDFQICTSTSEAKAGICRGDSGGPLTIKRNESVVQIGLSSFGYRKCEEGQPTVFTRLTRELVTWINEEVQDYKLQSIV